MSELLLFEKSTFQPTVFSNMFAWYDAADTNTVDASSVGQWNDKSGNGYHVTQSTAGKKPTYTSSGLNGKNVITFDGTDDFLDLPSGMLTLSEGASTAFIVSKQDIVGAEKLITLAATGNSTRYTTQYNASGLIEFQNNATASVVTNRTGFIATDWNIIVSRRSGSDLIIANNGSSDKSSAVAADAASITDGSIGADGTGAGSFFDGSIAEIIIYNRSLSAAEILIVNQYLSNKWGILIAGTLDLQSYLPSTYTLPYDVIYNGYTFASDVDYLDYKITPTNTYYISPTGSSGNNGLTIGTPKQSMDQAIALGNAAGAPFEVQVATGTYTRNIGWTTTPTQNFNVIGNGTPIISSEWETKTGFTLTATNTYKVTRSNTLAVFDSSVLDADNEYEKLTLAASQAACEGAAGTWYTDNVDVWVHASDERDLSADATAIKLMLNASAAQLVGDYHGYIENIQFEGGKLSSFTGQSSTSNDTQQLYFKGCSFKYSSQGNGYRCLGTYLTIMDDCISSINYLDGFNYHEGSNPVTSNIHELFCIGRNNGYSGSTGNNASTIHDGGVILRTSGIYKTSEGRNIHDIDDGTISVNIGCNSKDSKDGTDAGSINYTSGDGIDSGTDMYLIDCQSSGSNIDVSAQIGCNAYINTNSNLINGTNTEVGTIATLTPRLKSFSTSIDVPITSGLKLWLDASDIDTITKDVSNNVSQWSDKSESSNHAIEGTTIEMPLYVADARSGYPAIRWDGVDSELVTTNAITNPYTIYIIGKIANTSPAYLFDFRTGLTNSWVYTGSVGTDWGTQFYKNGTLTNFAPLGTSLFNGSWQYNAFVSTTAGSNKMYIGTRYTDVTGDEQSMEGDIHEILVYSRTLTSNERTIVESYLSNKWGL